MADYSLRSQYGSGTYNADAGQVLLGMEFYVTSDSWLTEIWIDLEKNNLDFVWQVWDMAAVKKLRGGIARTTTQGWTGVSIPTLPLEANKRYMLVYDSPLSFVYAEYASVHTTNDIVSGPLVAPSVANSTYSNNAYEYGASVSVTYPTGVTTGINYGLDVVISDTNAQDTNDPANVYSMRSQFGASAYEADYSQILMGMEFYVDSQAWLTKVHLDCEQGGDYAYPFRVWDLVDSTVVASGTITSPARGWHSAAVTPVELTPNRRYMYVFDTGTGGGSYASRPSLFQYTTFYSGPLVIPSNSDATYGQCTYNYGGNIDFVGAIPTGSFNETHYGHDVEVTTVNPAGGTGVLYRGTNIPDAIYRGSVAVDKVYRGSQEVWSML